MRLHGPEEEVAADMRRWACLLLALAAAGCGGASGASYSATSFRECLSARGVTSAGGAEASRLFDGRVRDALSPSLARAAEQNGVVEAFGSEEEDDVEGRTIDFLFFQSPDTAQQASDEIRRIGREVRHERRGNLLMLWEPDWDGDARRTAAQDRVIEECLARSETRGQ